VVQAIGNALIPVEDRVEKPGGGGGFNLNLPAIGGVRISRASKPAPSIAAPQSLNEALDVIRYVATKRTGKTTIIIDEMERIETAAEREVC
jgi:hypothetical protein